MTILKCWRLCCNDWVLCCRHPFQGQYGVADVKLRLSQWVVFVKVCARNVLKFNLRVKKCRHRKQWAIREPWRRKAPSLSFFCHVQLGAEQREREEDRQRHDDHQSQRGADGESRRSVREKQTPYFWHSLISCPASSVWTVFLDGTTSCSIDVLNPFKQLVSSLCWQVSLWAELWPAPSRPCPPGSPRWPSPRQGSRPPAAPALPLRPNPESRSPSAVVKSELTALRTGSGPRPWRLTVATVRRPASALYRNPAHCVAGVVPFHCLLPTSGVLLLIPSNCWEMKWGRHCEPELRLLAASSSSVLMPWLSWWQ